MSDTLRTLDAERVRLAHPGAGQPTAGGKEGALGSGPRRLLTAFALLTALAAHQLLVLGGHTDHYWSWTIHGRPTVAFLGAAYAAGFVLSVVALRQRSWRHVRIAVATVTAFTVLTLAATLVHAHKLHLSAVDPLARSAAWIWLTVYVTVPVAGLVVLVRQRSGPGSGAVGALPVRLRRVVGGQGLVLGVAGVALFCGGWSVHHGTGAVTEFWPWPLSPLSAQVLGAWLVALAVGAVLVVRERDLAALRVPAVTYTAFGVFQWAVLLAYRGETGVDGTALGVYAALLTVVVGTGGYGWWVVRRSTAASVGG